jgi:hypothetical protein
MNLFLIGDIHGRIRKVPQTATALPPGSNAFLVLNSGAVYSGNEKPTERADDAQAPLGM